MTEPYVFEYDGVKIEYRTASVRTRLEKRRLLRALMVAKGYQAGDVPLDEWDNFDEFTAMMAQSKADAPWWVSSMSTIEQVGAAYDCFMMQHESLLEGFIQATSVVSTPKKTE